MPPMNPSLDNEVIRSAIAMAHEVLFECILNDEIIIGPEENKFLYQKAEQLFDSIPLFLSDERKKEIAVQLLEDLRTRFPDFVPEEKTSETLVPVVEFVQQVLEDARGMSSNELKKEGLQSWARFVLAREERRNGPPCLN
jgi:hypothetical protein